MLGKLIKHEFKATARVFLPAFIGIIVLSLLCRLFFLTGFLENFANGAIPTLIYVFFALAMVALCTGAMIVICWRFYSNLLRDEGYLTHTLPVSIDSHIWTKLLVGSFWSIISVIVLLGCLMIAFLTSDLLLKIPFDLRNLINKLISELGVFRIVQIIILLILYTFNGLLSVYSAMAIGQLFDKHKIWGSILAYGVMLIVFSVVTSLVTMLATDWTAIDTSTGLSRTTNLLIGITLVESAIYYMITGTLWATSSIWNNKGLS